MAGLQAALSGAPDPILLVTFTVDPGHDTPDVLQAYATRAGAQSHWLFLTGQRDVVANLLRDGFHVAFADDGPADRPITHSDRFVLVDRQLGIRGYYHGSEAADVDRLIRDARVLRQAAS